MTTHLMSLLHSKTTNNLSSMPPASLFLPSLLRTLNDVKLEQFRGPRGTIAHRGRSGVYRRERTVVGRAAPSAHRLEQPPLHNCTPAGPPVGEPARSTRQHPTGNINLTAIRGAVKTPTSSTYLTKDLRNCLTSKVGGQQGQTYIPEDSTTNKGAKHS